MACGNVMSIGVGAICELVQGHAGYHEKRLARETVRWASAEQRCEDACPTHHGWSCSLLKDHAGPHQGWSSHTITSGGKPTFHWAQKPAPSVSVEIDEYDLLPDATPEELRALPDINSKKAS